MHVFVLGIDELNRRLLQHLPDMDGCKVHALLTYDELREVEAFPFEQLLCRCRRRLARHDGSVDAIVTLLDFPATELVPILAHRLGVPGPSLEAVARCNHKYWSRLLQREVAAAHVPAFAVVDPFDAPVAPPPGLDYPFWIKPMNGFRSYLSFHIGGPSDLEAAYAALREGLGRLSEPLGAILSHLDLPEPIAALPPWACIAEGALNGRLCTLEGYVHDRTPQVFGIVDSIRERNRITFNRYQYPSRLPRRVRRRMADIACRVVRHIGLDASPFNIEMFYDRSRDHVWILEVNPRISQSHCALFEWVDGLSHHKLMLDVALGRRPRMPRREGPCHCAAKFFIRHFGGDAVVSAVPDAARLRQIEQAIGHAAIVLEVHEGTRLSQLHNQESYSYELAAVYIGGDSPHQLLERFDRCRQMLGLKLEPVDRGCMEG